MENIIKKAIAGGYDPNWNVNRTEEFPELYNRAILDPLFWQALGKACRWKKIPANLDGKKVMFPQGDTEYSNAWKYYTLHFHEINLTEGWDKAVAYLHEVAK